MSTGAIQVRHDGLEGLIQALRSAGLPVGCAEAIDAATLLNHLAFTSHKQTIEALRLKLRPVLCKSVEDQSRFNDVFEVWKRDIDQIESPHASAKSDVDRAPAAATAAAPATSAHGVPHMLSERYTHPAAAAPTSRTGRRVALAMLFLVTSVGGAVWLLMTSKQVPADAPTASAPTQAMPLPSATPNGTASQIPTATAIPEPGGAAQTAVRVPRPGASGVDTAQFVGQGERSARSAPLPLLLLVTCALPLLLGLLALLLSCGHPLPYITRRRGGRPLLVEGWPSSKHQHHLVRAIPSSTGGQLQRHVRSAADRAEEYARRPQLDLRRTVQATIARGGVPTLRNRFARLRPSYLVLVHAAQSDNIGVLWSLRLRELDTRVAIFAFDTESLRCPTEICAIKSSSAPLCVEVGGTGRRIPFNKLPTPWPEQRLIVVAATDTLFDAMGDLLPWVREARLERWTQRALFTPDEPRDWIRSHVERLEQRHGTDHGMHVLPFDDNALNAWSEYLVHGHMPLVELSEPQLYPELLRRDETWFVDLGQSTGEVPAIVSDGAVARQLVTELQAYLGQNGFYWLCACAVPPVIDQRLALLLGEQYFRHCGAKEERIPIYMARSWRLMVRLPWLRDTAAQMPQWLRLMLLGRLPFTIQEELRNGVRIALHERITKIGSENAMTLGFESPDEPSDFSWVDAGGKTDERYALMVGFLRDEMTAEELALCLPGEWQHQMSATLRPRSIRRRFQRRCRSLLRQGMLAYRLFRYRFSQWTAVGGLLGLATLFGLHRLQVGQDEALFEGFITAAIAWLTLLTLLGARSAEDPYNSAPYERRDLRDQSHDSGLLTAFVAREQLVRSLTV